MDSGSLRLRGYWFDDHNLSSFCIMIWSERFKKVKKCNGILRERNFSRTFAWLIQALLLAKKERNFNFFRKSVSETTRVLDLSWPSRKGCLRVCPPWLYYLEYQASWNKITGRVNWMSRGFLPRSSCFFSNNSQDVPWWYSRSSPDILCWLLEF